LYLRKTMKENLQLIFRSRGSFHFNSKSSFTPQAGKNLGTTTSYNGTGLYTAIQLAFLDHMQSLLNLSMQGVTWLSTSAT